MKNDFLVLTTHGKKCLRNYLLAISASDLLTTQLDFLNKNGLTDYKSKFNDPEKRYPVAGECLTDLGLKTAKHYANEFMK